MRRIVSNNYGYDELYKGGLSIRTPLNSFYQVEAVKALREGLEEYDKRHSWRGPIKNIKKGSLSPLFYCYNALISFKIEVL